VRDGVQLRPPVLPGFDPADSGLRPATRRRRPLPPVRQARPTASDGDPRRATAGQRRSEGGAEGPRGKELTFPFFIAGRRDAKLSYRVSYDVDADDKIVLQGSGCNTQVATVGSSLEARN